MKRWFIINGYPMSGKDTFVNLIKDNTEYNVLNTSAVSKVKELAMEIGWDGVTKGPKERKFLSDLKDLLDNFNKFSIRSIEDTIDYFYSDESNDDLLFIHMRQPEDIKMIVDEFPEISTIFIHRDNHDSINCHADANVENYEYDFRIENNGTLDDFKDVAIAFVENLI